MVIIRRAGPHDAGALARLAEDTFRDTFGSANDPADMELHCAKSFGDEMQLREIEDPNLVTILGEEHSELGAFAQVRLHSPKRWHGLGIAHELMREVLATVRLVASDRIWLGVWHRNERALAFYRKFGFEVTGNHVFLLGRDPQRDLIMATEVGR